MKLILLVLQKFLLAAEKIFDLLNGKYTYPEFEIELNQTAMNTLKRIGNIENYKKTDTKKKIKVLYIEADEDHIHLQNGKSETAKLIYVHEGKNQVVDGRNELKNPKYFSGIYDGEKIEDLWKDVWTYIKGTYDEDYIKRIYITGDGAEWIKFGAEYLPNAIPNAHICIRPFPSTKIHNISFKR